MRFVELWDDNWVRADQVINLSLESQEEISDEPEDDSEYVSEKFTEPDLKVIYWVEIGLRNRKTLIRSVSGETQGRSLIASIISDLTEEVA